MQNNPAILEFCSQLDTCIEQETSVDVFQLPLDYIDGLTVEPIASTYHEEKMHYLLRVNQHEIGVWFIRVSTSDGGVLFHYSDLQPAESVGKLLLESEEDWNLF